MPDFFKITFEIITLKPIDLVDSFVHSHIPIILLSIQYISNTRIDSKDLKTNKTQKRPVAKKPAIYCEVRNQTENIM